MTDTRTPTTATVSVPVVRTPAPLRVLEKYALPLLTVLVFVFFSFFSLSAASFPTLNNITVILGSQAVVALVAIAALFPLVAGYFDFSLGANAAMTQVMTAGLMSAYSVPLPVAIVISLALGVLVGVVNGYFVTRLHMSPFVTTLGMSMLLAGLMAWFTGGRTFVSGIDPAIILFGSTRLLGVPLVFYITLAVGLVAWYFFSHTPFGRSLYAIGSNATAAKLVGLPVTKNVWWSFIVAGSIAGLAGVLQLARVGSATASDGGLILFPALAAVFLGATTIRPGFFNVWGTIIGAVFVSVSVSGLALSGASGWASNVFNGAALLAAVALSTYLGRSQRRG
ncbi:ABC transporter permease [Microbacterium sp. SORGH_AS_0862]|uniref:ABC transporter permease n=1 Tax=Microbacterium sp. SORGH_AS_0862 TaxID=3041789 RepID=UPI0027924FA9|nr:ABC transporter permease [Microbacterium sp. SORGH_AS_0862]MDQ1204810.1 ribose transport system permease protein [Microbacterium sp. SORGH_AS_0862]